MKPQILANTTYGGKIIVYKKAFQKAAKLCAIKGCSRETNRTSDEAIKYLRAKNAAFHHALDRAGIYSMRIVGRNIFVI